MQKHFSRRRCARWSQIVRNKRFVYFLSLATWRTSRSFGILFASKIFKASSFRPSSGPAASLAFIEWTSDSFLSSFPAIITNKQNFNDGFYLAGVDQNRHDIRLSKVCIHFSRVCQWQRHTRFWIFNRGWPGRMATDTRPLAKRSRVRLFISP